MCIQPISNVWHILYVFRRNRVRGVHTTYGGGAKGPCPIPRFRLSMHNFTCISLNFLSEHFNKKYIAVDSYLFHCYTFASICIKFLIFFFFKNQEVINCGDRRRGYNESQLISTKRSTIIPYIYCYIRLVLQLCA